MERPFTDQARLFERAAVAFLEDLADRAAMLRPAVAFFFVLAELAALVVFSGSCVNANFNTWSI